METNGTLPKGVLIEGTLYREFSLREQIVADEVEILESEHGDRAAKSDGFFNVCIMAKRISLEGYSGEITPEMVMGMAIADFNHLVGLDKGQTEKRASFRDAAEAAPDAGTGTPEAGV